MHPVQAQYEAFPYPPVPTLALPAAGQGTKLAYETGTQLAQNQGLTLDRIRHDNLRLLVVGCGTLETLVVAQAHPRAAEIVAVDLSERSLAILKRRWRLLQLSRWLPWRPWRLPRLRLVPGDFRRALSSEAPFDYILATNVLHHTDDPAGGLWQLAQKLKPGGLLRLVTYPKASRIWMRRTGSYLREQGVEPSSPQLVRMSQAAVRRLPEQDPRRLCFEHNPESRQAASLIDAFLHVLEAPLAPLEWQQAAEASGLRLLGEGQDADSSSGLLDSVLPEAGSLSVWEKLQLLDDCLELVDNPVLWFVRQGDPQPLPPSMPPTATATVPAADELQDNRARIAALLAPIGLTPEVLLGRLRQEVGPHCSADGNHPLTGLALSDYL